MHRRHRLLIAAAVLLVGILAFFVLRNTTVDFATFDAGFSEALKEGNFQVVEVRTSTKAMESLPLLIKLHPRSWIEPREKVAFPNSSTRYSIKQGDSATFDCAIQYLNRRAGFIEIKSTPGQQAMVAELRSSLARKFPGLPVELAGP